MNVYGIFDNCVMSYITIFTERDDKVAERNFKIARSLAHDVSFISQRDSERLSVSAPGKI